ncbi:hypothetical protein LTR08_006500 [Meristemomyces frigidus]|nr:hypothetical protein LTR08_006500 [Meristemomyces frigidus]
MLLQPLTDLYSWQFVAAEAERVLAMQIQYRQRIRNGAVHSIDYDLALRQLQFTLELHLFEMVARLRDIVYSINAFPYCVKRYTDRFGLHVSKKPEDIFKSDPLAWNVLELLNYDKDCSLDLSWHVAFIDDVISHATPKERARVDTVLYSQLSNMTAVSDAIISLKSNVPHHGPKLDRSHYDTMLINNYAFRDYSLNQVVIRSLVSLAKPNVQTVCSTLKAALKDFLGMPMPKARLTESTSCQVYNLHIGLIGFWSKVRKCAAGSFIQEYQTKASTEDQEYWGERTGMPEQPKLTSQPTVKQPTPPQPMWGSVAEDMFRLRQAKDKQKTRSTATSLPVTPAPQRSRERTAPAQTAKNPAPTAVSKASKALLTSMFVAAADTRSSTC